MFQFTRALNLQDSVKHQVMTMTIYQRTASSPWNTCWIIIVFHVHTPFWLMKVNERTLLFECWTKETSKGTWAHPHPEVARAICNCQGDLRQGHSGLQDLVSWTAWTAYIGFFLGPCYLVTYVCVCSEHIDQLLFWHWGWKKPLWCTLGVCEMIALDTTHSPSWAGKACAYEKTWS